MEVMLELARAKDTEQRMAGVERIHHLLESSRRALSLADTSALIDYCLDLLRDTNRVSQGTLQAVTSIVVLSGDHLNSLLPTVIDRLGMSPTAKNSWIEWD